jgi:hypothetical protein
MQHQFLNSAKTFQKTWGQLVSTSAFTFGDLLAWSERLVNCQRDALRRVLSGRPTETDIAELTAMAKAAHGVSKPGTPMPAIASEAHIRAVGPADPTVAILAVREIKFVNALAPGPVIFSQNGLTLIYGDNASGKSGIARILKKAGRARNPGGLIRPSVFEADPGQPANATVEYSVGTINRSTHWTDGVATDNDLARINVFDSSCATLQVEASNHLSYTPEILRVFQDLAQTCRAVGMRLRSERDELDSTRRPELAQLFLRPNTKAGMLVQNLSADTIAKEIEGLCEISNEERQRHTTLSRALQDDPSRLIDLLSVQARRLTDIDGLLANLEGLLSDVSIASFESRLADARVVNETAAVARQIFAGNAVIEGVGTSEWRQLWESARRYSETAAYPTERFPVTRLGAICVLCQQQIEESSGRRLNAFEEFVQSDVQRRADAARGLVEARKTEIVSVRIPQS